MAVCESCGERVQDGLTICPECGRPVVKMKTNLGLRSVDGKKITNTVAFSPADEFGDMIDSHSVGGSEPVKLSQEKLDDYKEEVRRSKKKRGPGILGWMIRLLVLFAIGYGVYYLFMNVILKPDGPTTYEECLDLLVENINSNDVETMIGSVPMYITANRLEAENFLSDMCGSYIDTYNVMPGTVHDFSKGEMEHAADEIQLNHGKTVVIKEAITCKVKLRGTAKNNIGNKVKRYAECEMTFYNIKGVWYFDMENFDTSEFTKIKIDR